MTVERTGTPGPFDDAWIKWAWSIRHAQKFAIDAITFADELEPEAFEIDEQYDADRGGFALVFTAAPIPPSRLGLRLGDAVHNLRAALDHVAWAMVERGRTPSNKLRSGARTRVAFPLCTHKAALGKKDTKGWVRSCKNMLPGVRRADLAIVRAVQPYNIRKRDVLNHALVILSDLDNLNKHREIHPLVTFPLGGEINIDDWEDCTPPAETEIWMTGDPIEVGVELGFIPVRQPGANPKLSVDSEITIEMSIRRNIEIGDWFLATQNMVRSVLLVLADPPGEIDEILSEIETEPDSAHDEQTNGSTPA